MTIAPALACVVTVVVATTAFRRARRAALRRFPAALLDELRTHKLECLREPAARVQLELSLLLGDDHRRGRLTRLASRIRRRPAAPAILRPGTAARRS